jgi:hypothetical protein
MASDSNVALGQAVVSWSAVKAKLLRLLSCRLNHQAPPELPKVRPVPAVAMAILERVTPAGSHIPINSITPEESEKAVLPTKDRGTVSNWAAVGRIAE